MKKMKILVLVALVALMSNVAFAGMMVELRAVSATGTTTVTDAHNVVAGAVGDTIQLQVWATLSGSSTGNYQFQLAQGFVTETVPTGYKAKGDLTWGTTTGQSNYVYTAPYNTSSLPSTTTNTAGDKEIGLLATNAFSARQGSMAVATGDPFQIGVLTYTINALNANGTANTTVNFVPKNTNTGASYYVDATKYSGNTNVSGSGTTAPFAYTAGSGVTITTVVPEPSTLILLGMGALALVFIRRK
jgi:hypothetical protein